VDCETWYFNDDLCTNDGVNNGGNESFENMQECCEAKFDGNDCFFQDVCSPTPLSTPSPTTKAASPAPTPCDNRKWYILMTPDGAKHCTNGYDVPDGVDGLTLFDNKEDCCFAEFDEDECSLKDVCIEVTETDSLAPTQVPTSALTTAMPTTAEPTNAELFTAVPTTAVPTTAEPTTAEPTIAEVITAEPTTAEPAMDCEKWYFNGDECTNDWENFAGNESFDDMQKCCEAEFDVNDCFFEDICFTTPLPTPGPTTAEPTIAEPTTSELITAEPTTPEPTTAEPTIAEISSAEPTPTTAEPTKAEPTTADPTIAVRITIEPTRAEPTTAEPTNAELITAEPTTPEPTTAEPTIAELITAEPTKAEPTTADPTIAELITIEPTTSEPTTNSPTFGSTPVSFVEKNLCAFNTHL
jgi:hypothetical protein